ncbi:retrovirus-related Pol polyprotein from transposon 412 isoform X2 [Paramormyrops kingsleyae]
MEDREIIRKSTSEYASPLVLVWKKTGDLRICTDFRWLNKRTLKDAHPLPHQADCLAALGGNSLFSTMDLTSGFYNMPLHEEDKKYSAFTTPMGLYEYNRLPQGLCNSPGSFMRMMMSIFGDQNYLSLLCYLDDLLVFAPDEESALLRLKMVFERLRSHNLKLAPKKCFFLRRSVRFLGHIVGENGVSTDHSKVESIKAMSSADLMDPDGVTPSQKRIRSFLGMINYYQHFVPGYSTIAKPLFDLLKGERRKRTGQRDRTMGRKLCAADWTPQQEQAFDHLKASLVNSMILAHPDFTRPFMLSTDASLEGIGAVLSQIQDGDTRARPIAFASKSLTQAQRNYPAHRLEFLALKWSICDKFSHWLKGHKFTVWTDNNPLTHILTKPKLDCCEQRWVAKLASYDFDIKYVPGRQNIVADALSRVPFVKESVGQRLLTEPYVNLLSDVKDVSCNSVRNAFKSSSGHVKPVSVSNIVQSQCDSPHVWAQSIGRDDVSAVLQSHMVWEAGPRSRAVQTLRFLPQLIPPGINTLPAYTEKVLRDKQLDDSTLSRVLYYVERRWRPSRRARARESVSVTRYLKHWDKLTVSNGVLYRVSKDPKTGAKRSRYVVPDSLRVEVLKGVHDEAGHQAQSRTLSLVRERFFWTNIDRDVRDYVRHCQRCIVSKTADPEGRAPLESITTTRPLELVCIDFWSAENSCNKSIDVLVITDHFTRLAQAFPCKDQTAKQVAKVLWDKYFCVFGFPERIHSDQGTNFESRLISELLMISGVKKSRTTPYHPMGNGSVERFNRTLGCMIRALSPAAKADWPRRLQTLTFMYNCTAHETTGYPPFYLMFGRVPRLPVDVLFRTVLHNSTVTSYDKYVASLTNDLKEALLIAQEHAVKEQRRHAHLYNRKVKGSNIEVGDRVLLANKTERGKKKLADKWESTIYTVMDMNAKTHTYRICDTVTGREKVVHRNLLLLVSFLPVDNEIDMSDLLPNMSTAEPSPSVIADVGSESETLVERESENGCSSGENFDVGSLGGSPACSGDEVGLLPDAEPVDSERRTADWITQFSTPNLSQVDVSDVASETSGLQEAFSSPSTIMPGQSVTCDSVPTTDIAVDIRQSVVASENTTQTHNAPYTLFTADQSPLQCSNFSNAQTPVRSRFGRLVKPVNRLIQSMSRQDVVRDNFSVKSVCKAVLHSLVE